MCQLFQQRWYVIVTALLLLGLLAFLAIHSLAPTANMKTTTQHSSPPGITTHQSPTGLANTPQVMITPTLTPTPTIKPNQPLQLSTDPYSNSTSQYRTEVEPSSYAYGTTIVTAFQAGRFVDIGSSNIGWATSIDGGTSWQKGFLQGTTKLAYGPYDRITDPAVTYDAAHNTWMIATVVFIENQAGIAAPAVVVSLSMNGGTIWSDPITILNSGHNRGLDKDWITCDNTPASPYFGTCYAQWDDYTRGDLIEMSTSRDGGRTWGAVKTTADQARGTSGYPLVQPNGTVIVPISNANETGIMVFRSTNGGASWSRTVPLTPVTSFASNAYFRDNILLTPQVDHAGTIYLVWVDCRFEPNCRGNDLVMTTSSDGLSWSPVRRISIAPVGSDIDYYVSGLGIDAITSGTTAHLGLTFYYYRASCFNNCTLSVGFVSSSNGGGTWSPTIRLAGSIAGSWVAQGNNKVGDYIATSFSNGQAFPIFALATAPTAGHFNEAMYTIKGGIAVSSSS
ncbi:MAG TPA: sialidase family protein [Ktedonobacteraceae bacterium]|nr:sialidase family protein [Ktedonobacteraceae bacterium]